MPGNSVATAVAAAALVWAVAAPAWADPARNVVLVHGAFADGSGWKPVAEILRKDGYTVSIVQEPETSLADDVAATNRVLDRQSGPAVLVGHSYGGAVITEAGNSAHVASLVYVAAFAPRTATCWSIRRSSRRILRPTCRPRRRSSWRSPRCR